MIILVCNAGSSSLKCSLIDSQDETTLATGHVSWAGATTHYCFAAGIDRHTEDVAWRGHAEAVRRVWQDLTAFNPRLPEEIIAVGHRIVHGGEFQQSQRITAEVRTQLHQLEKLAPLHNPPSIATLHAAEKVLPRTPHIAVFDTAFHAGLPPEASTYPVPQQWTKEWGIRRYGFHGLSHAYCSHRAAELCERPFAELRIVICHLGHGCSAAAVQGGVCVDTTMGFTPLEGLMMATRSGSLDPGVILHVQQNYGMAAADVENCLNRQAGLLGVSGVSADMREVNKAAADGNEDARLAREMYIHRIRQAIGALTATLGGIDALVFTGGVGEHDAELRSAVCARLGYLHLHIDDAKNTTAQGDADISPANSAGRVLVITSREDLTMLHEVVDVLA